MAVWTAGFRQSIRSGGAIVQKIRSDLKAIQDWDDKDFLTTTWTERVAMTIRRERKKELIGKLYEIAARN